MDPVWGDPREGKPFGGADRDEASYEGWTKGSQVRDVGNVREAVEAYQPRGISDATVIKPQYIGTDDDEPWHASSRQTISITKADLAQGEASTLPFVAPEAALGDATRKAKDSAGLQAAMETAMKTGARKGSPAVIAAEKVLAAFEKGDEKAAKKAMPKAPKPPGAQGKGWDDMGRSVAKTHDNSVA
jgi:hypothetical protein